jgi:hypothetical protein
MKDAEIYQGKKISELLKQIVDNCEDEKARALEMYESISKECSSKEQMMLIGPVAAEYLEIAAKQTDNLIRLAETIRKYHALDLDGGNERGLTEVERLELLKHLEDTGSDPLSERQKESASKPASKSAPTDQFIGVDFGEEEK